VTEHVLEREQFVDRPLEQVFSFFSAARNLESLTPEWLRFEVMTPEPIGMRAGTLIEYRLSVHGVPLRWVSQIKAWEHNRSFVDQQPAARTASGTTHTSSWRSVTGLWCVTGCATRSH
jgi:ligand-binding SRPBCC domain-containing protein